MFSLPAKLVGTKLINNVIPSGISLKGYNLLSKLKFSSLSQTNFYQLQTSPLQYNINFKNTYGIKDNFSLTKSSIRYYVDAPAKKEKVKSNLRIQIIPAGPLSVNCCIINDEKSKEVCVHNKNEKYKNLIFFI